jgi:spermidine/putrescine transport system ATP-binding protein
MDVEQNVAFGLRMQGLANRERSARVAEYLELVGLRGYASRFPSQLSGGQQQRVALARALAKRPAVLLLDEPLGALDLKLRRQMQAELARIHRQVGTTFVFVTHDQEEALSMATRIAVMSGGRVRQVGTPREIYDHPADRFVADFIGESNFVAGHVEDHGSAPWLRMADGIRLPLKEGVRTGPATLMVRPEAARVGPSDGAPAGSLPGRVIQVAFMGDHTRVTLDTTAGAFVVLRPHDGAEIENGLVRPGEEACVWWSAESATLLGPEIGGD